MKNVLYFVIAAMLIAATCGCNSSQCGERRSWFSWWNRGDSCRTCTTGDCMEGGGGMLNTPILNSVPTGPRSSGVETLPFPGPVGPVN
jgi:hypothetical protein